MNSSGDFIPWERRRKVPWSALDILALFFLYLALTSCGVVFAQLFCVPGRQVAETVVTTEHPLSQLIRQSQGSSFALLVVFFSAVVSAPLAEEFLFRLVLQGWLEKQESSFFKRRFLPHGSLSIVFSSLFFAALHGGGRKEHGADTLFFTLLGVGTANVFFTLGGMAFLRIGRRATWRDLGLRFNHLPTDFGIAMVFFVLFVPPIFFIHVAAQNLFPETVTDPIPLFFFALALGFLFYRTRRLAGCVLLHAMLNATSFVALVVAR